MAEVKSRKWWYFLPTVGYVIGPAEFAESITEKEFRRRLLRVWFPKRERLPVGVKCWPREPK